MSLADLAILSLATWRISSLLVNEMGPGDVLERMRYRVGVRYDEYSARYGQNVVAEALTCVWCSSVWIALALAVLFWLWPGTIWLALPFALSGGAVLVEEVVDGG